MEGMDWPDARISDREAEFIAARDSFYMATVGDTRWPYVQYRGGPTGFLKVLDESTLAYADFRGNLQYISTGNLSKGDRVALFLMDYPNKKRLKIAARTEVFDIGDRPDLGQQLVVPGYKAKIERAFGVPRRGLRLELSAAHHSPTHRVGVGTDCTGLRDSDHGAET
jgi:hypothetical protein